jgi:hypothetical protein
MDSEENNHHYNDKKPRPSIKFATMEEKIKDLNEKKPKKAETAFKKRLSWDVQNIEEHELEKIKNPKRKIDEPKTPYIYHEDEDNKYLSKLTEINKLQPTVHNL